MNGYEDNFIYHPPRYPGDIPYHQFIGKDDVWTGLSRKGEGESIMKQIISAEKWKRMTSDLKAAKEHVIKLQDMLKHISEARDSLYKINADLRKDKIVLEHDNLGLTQRLHAVNGALADAYAYLRDAQLEDKLPSDKLALADGEDFYRPSSRYKFDKDANKWSKTEIDKATRPTS